MALRIWDIGLSDYRDATQLDLDELQEYRVAYGRLQGRYAEDRAVLLRTLLDLRSRAGAPNDMVANVQLVPGDG